MEDEMKEIMILCIRYHEMYMMERAVKNCEDMNHYDTLHKAYILDKESFDAQYTNVENLINTNQKY